LYAKLGVGSITHDGGEDKKDFWQRGRIKKERKHSVPVVAKEWSVAWRGVWEIKAVRKGILGRCVMSLQNALSD